MDVYPPPPILVCVCACVCPSPSTPSLSLFLASPDFSYIFNIYTFMLTLTQSINMK